MAQQGIRLIGGQWKHSVLKVRELPGLRPTLVRLRKTLADWMRPLQPLTMLDLFAGTGSLGFELASEGARRVVLVEQHPLAVADLRANIARLPGAAERMEVIAADSLLWVGGQSDAYDLVVLDPPFKADFATIVVRATQSAVCGAHTQIYCEQPRRSCLAPPPSWRVEREARSGEVVAQLWINGKKES